MGNRRLTRLGDVIAMSPDGARMEELSSFQEGLWVFHAQFGTGVVVNGKSNVLWFSLTPVSNESS